MHVAGRVILGLSGRMLAGCIRPGDAGYVEIKTVPIASRTSTTLFLERETRTDKKGVAVLRQRLGTAKLAIEGGGGQIAVLCDIVVNKNRITSVTISGLDRQPRCQCGNPAGKGKACLS